MRKVRGGRIGLIFQEPMRRSACTTRSATRSWRRCAPIASSRKAAARERAIELLREVGIPRPETRIDAYPFQLSGGLRQRVGIALALAADPEILIADEPTTALDVTTQAQILALLRRLQRTKGVALMLITHDMGVIAQMADDVAVMYLGRVVEFAPVRAALRRTRSHPYTRALLRSVPSMRAVPRERLATIGGAVPHPGSAAERLRRSIRAARRSIAGRCAIEAPPAIAARRSGRELLPRDGARWAHDRASRSSDLSKYFPIRSGLLQRETGRVRAVEDVSFTIARGETLALVGESGCGKTTVARCILRALPPTSGAIRFSPRARHDGRPRAAVAHGAAAVAPPHPDDLPGSLCVAEPAHDGRRHHRRAAAGQRRAGGRSAQARVRELLDLVGLPAAARTRFPHAFSGGQRQRIGIARALALDPTLVVADEPVSALDVSVQAQIINLLLDLQDRLGLSMLFVAHDLGVVRHVSDRVAVMYVGRIVEVAPTMLSMRAAPSLHRGAARRRAQGRSAAARPGRRAARRGRRSGQPAAGLRLPSALPACGRPLPHRDSGATRSSPGTLSACHRADGARRSPALPEQQTEETSCVAS